MIRNQTLIDARNEATAVLERCRAVFNLGVDEVVRTTRAAAEATSAMVVAAAGDVEKADLAHFEACADEISHMPQTPFGRLPELGREEAGEEGDDGILYACDQTACPNCSADRVDSFEHDSKRWVAP